MKNNCFFWVKKKEDENDPFYEKNKLEGQEVFKKKKGNKTIKKIKSHFNNHKKRVCNYCKHCCFYSYC